MRHIGRLERAAYCLYLFGGVCMVVSVHVSVSVSVQPFT